MPSVMNGIYLFIHYERLSRGHSQANCQKLVFDTSAITPISISIQFSLLNRLGVNNGLIKQIKVLTIAYNSYKEQVTSFSKMMKLCEMIYLCYAI